MLPPVLWHGHLWNFSAHLSSLIMEVMIYGTHLIGYSVTWDIVKILYFFKDDDEDPGLLEQLKSQVCDNIALYAQKYDEEFQPYLPQFVTSVWNLLVTTDLDPKYDLVSWVLQFL